METTLFYLLRVSIAATILYLFFKFILSKRTFHALNRIVVLCMVVMTLVLPLFTITLPIISFFQPKVETATSQLTVEQVLALLKAGGYFNGSTIESTPATEIPGIKIFGVIYLIGFTLALMRFSISFIRMSRIIRLTQKAQLDDNSLLCISDKKVSPFSWMKYIVLSKDDFTDENKDIIRHEQAHVAFGHSYDLLFLDLYSLVFWFNPFAWLLRLELQTIHEYQADEKVLAEGANAKNYHLSLIRQCVGEYKFALANNFEYNNLHKRIKMTMGTKSSSRQKWLYGTIGLSVMLCIVVLSFSGLKAKAADLKEMIKSELSAADSTQKPTPSVVRIRKVDVKNNETVTPQIIVGDTVAPDSKIKVRLSPNEDIRVVGYGTQLVTESKANHSPLGLNLNGTAKPMIIVDGKEYFQSIDAINPNDILSIEVLKDASATKLYGDKGKNGVILITTKKNAASSTNNELKINTSKPLKLHAELVYDKEKDAGSASNEVKNNKGLRFNATFHKDVHQPLTSVDGKEAPANPIQISIANIEAITIPMDTTIAR
ncbi:peptidase M56 BlaR1 [Paludibacter propionicigenes WB4]|uniref:Peptidase M56 BlaR1 n=1 Tax=Paludibacter propionicigenes (strain DSM 17365 / JCM 13257 / WB4) TaxID=694427 RepID=E4T1B7_PALPW|nr:M56 family metallopeptidase [Paludibacter propionicigenes]ADQ78511.1 peptidase M56 BlaR1 [Paludibacter propionicigenes WB4]